MDTMVPEIVEKPEGEGRESLVSADGGGLVVMVKSLNSYTEIFELLSYLELECR